MCFDKIHYPFSPRAITPLSSHSCPFITCFTFKIHRIHVVYPYILGYRTKFWSNGTRSGAMLLKKTGYPSPRSLRAAQIRVEFYELFPIDSEILAIVND